MTEVQVPRGAAVQGTTMEGSQGTGVIVDNRTTLPDHQVREAIMAQWAEFGAMQFGHPTSFQLYTTSGSSALARSPFVTPSNVIDEIKLARNVAETDDDVTATVGQMIATAFRDGMQNLHEDEQTTAWFNECARVANLDVQLKEMFREYVVTGQLNTLSLFSRQRLSVTVGRSEVQNQLAIPKIGVLPAENIRVVSNDIFSDAELAYDVSDQQMVKWLDEFFNDSTTVARKRQMSQEEPVLATLFTDRFVGDWNDSDPLIAGKTLYKLNPRMVHRTTMPKGASPYPRPGLTADFPLLEAKRLLNIMDYSLLQGGTNYIVVAKQGSDKLPAQQPEIDNLSDQVRRASRTGVLVGDHRLTVDIITPDLTELLNPAKRKLIGRKLAMALLRIPEQVTGDGGAEATRQESDLMGNTITSDRRDVKRHVEGFVYSEIAQRNRSTFPKGPPNIWFPRIVLSGVKDFYTNVVQARDRGDIPRKWAVEILGFDYEAGVAERKREKARGDDEVMTPGSVPFSPQNNGQPQGHPGRPPGSGPDNGRPGAIPNQNQTAPQPPNRRALVSQAEDIHAVWDADAGEVQRIGVLTEVVLAEFPDRQIGRLTSIERNAVAATEAYQHGPVAIIPVNVNYTVGEVKAVRLAEGLSMLIGQRTTDQAYVAVALCFREPQFDVRRAQETAMRWGFVTGVQEDGELLQGEVLDPPTAEDVAAAIATRAQEAVAGVNFAGVLQAVQASLATSIAEAVAKAMADAEAMTLRNGKKSWIYLTCPTCGAVQDAANEKCPRCDTALADARKAMFAQGDPPVHYSPPPPISGQPDKREKPPENPSG